MSISDEDGLVEAVVEEYHLLWNSDEEREPQSETFEKLELLKMLVQVLDSAKSSGSEYNVLG